MAPHSTLLPKSYLSLILACCSSFALVCFAFPTAQAGTTWDGSGANTNIDTAGNWNDDINPLLTAGNQTLTFGTGGSNATINTDVNALGLIINRDANFEIANGAGNLTIGTGGITVTLPSTTARTHTISESNIILSGSQTWSVTNNTGAATLNVSSVISGVNTTLTKSGTGTLTLSGNNSFTGAIYATAGYLNVNHNNALGANSGTVFTAGYGTNTAVRLNGGVTVTGKTLQVNGGGLSNDGQLVFNE